MKIVIAPDSYKGCMTAAEVAEAMARGVRRLYPQADLDLVPMADGGEGTVQALVDATGGTLIPCTVTGPLGEPVAATFGMMGEGETAVIEMAGASGLPLVPAGRRNPLLTTTYGTGELIRQALGIRFLDAQGRDLPPGGGALAQLDRIDTSGLDPRL